MAVRQRRRPARLSLADGHVRRDEEGEPRSPGSPLSPQMTSTMEMQTAMTSTTGRMSTSRFDAQRTQSASSSGSFISSQTFKSTMALSTTSSQSPRSNPTGTTSTPPTSIATSVATSSISMSPVDPQFSGRQNRASASTTSTSIAVSTSPANAETLLGDKPAPRNPLPHTEPLSKGAEAALITCAVLGFVALAIGAFIFLKRRHKRRAEQQLRHAESAFDPSNGGSLHAPETRHLDSFDRDDKLVSGPQTDPFADHGTAQSERPGPASLPYSTFSVSSQTTANSAISEASRNFRFPSTISDAQRTPNPFAEPPLNKAYDQLRGRPRSTTLTDRGSWERNPFKDPGSERFDPFGEMEQRARQERVRYLEEAIRADKGSEHR